MVVRSRSGVYFHDEENGKRHDDHKPGKFGPWNVKSRPGWRRRRVALLLLAAAGIWLFIRYMPTDLLPVDKRFPNLPPPPNRAMPHEERQKQFEETRQAAANDHPARADSILRNSGNSPARNYDGPIKFFRLASSLRSASLSGLYGGESTNILFVAADMGSAAALVPLACEMGSVWKKNTVHIAIMGRSELDMEELRAINDARRNSCLVTWHDARPDYVDISSERRMQISVAGALGHIEQYLKPVAMITTDLESEDTYFSLGLQKKLKQLPITHIQVPKHDTSKLRWLTRLDHASLGAWHSASFDILVRAPLDSSGSLVRLLKSLASADYTGFNPPRLIIELPHKVDKIIQHFLDGFKWPPHDYHIPGQNDQLTIRRRISDQRENAEEASLRFIESFYPSSPAGPHVLLLSPQVELSPVFFHYLKLHLLEYKHSVHAMGSSFDLFGLSLEAPSTYLNGSQFHPPVIESNDEETDPQSSFRWQAPNSNAALYFADKWIEVHSFLQKRHSAIKRTSVQGYYRDMASLVTINTPTWVEYFLEFMRTRGWSLHYPQIHSYGFPEISEALAVVHNELYQLPEELTKPENEDLNTLDSGPLPPTESVIVIKDDYLDAHPSSQSSSQRVRNEENPLLQQLDTFLIPPPLPQRKPSNTGSKRDRYNPYDEAEDGFYDEQEEAGFFFQPPAFALPPISNLPLLDNDGEHLAQDELLSRAEGVRMSFRQYGGGCSKEQALLKEKKQAPLSAEDLFCFDEPELKGQVVERTDNTESYKDTVASDSRATTPNIPNTKLKAKDIERIANAETPDVTDDPHTSPTRTIKENKIPHGADGADTRAAAGLSKNTLPEAKPNTNRNTKPDDDNPISPYSPFRDADVQAHEPGFERPAFPTLDPTLVETTTTKEEMANLEEATAELLAAAQLGRDSLMDHDDEEFVRLAAPKVAKASRLEKVEKQNRRISPDSSN